MLSKIIKTVIIGTLVSGLGYLAIYLSNNEPNLIAFVSTILGTIFAIAGGHIYQSYIEEIKEQKKKQEMALMLYMNTSRLLEILVKDIIQGMYSGLPKYTYKISDDWLEWLNGIYGIYIDKEEYEIIIDIYNEIDYVEKNIKEQRLTRLSRKVFHPSICNTFFFNGKFDEQLESSSSVRFALSDKCNNLLDKIKEIAKVDYDI